ncbi:catechol 1,2-dioxygenase [Neisseria leonii]|uniref:catechol 1,2-dioxygenase n=1 Tax=Neisseria leonii TaxID=2995413 RepID=UPI00237B030B|nr:catechol 1,2-dioxygenase [Neisseria sp. 3986]MDD9325043.1 catechol 1,2-dioxygenase [Neisseria sp. 3986]
MNHQQIEQLVKAFNIDTARGETDSRIQAITVRLVCDLFKAIEDLDLSPYEIWKGMEFLTDAAKNNELGLIAAGLGLERFIDIRADEEETRMGLAGGTPRTIEGPLYVYGAPESIGFARMDDGTDTDGKPLVLEGTVYDAQGNPLPNAKVELWQANTKGNYSFFDKTQSDFNLRRTIFTDSDGHYKAHSILPHGYGCPPGSHVDTWLKKLGRHGRRPAHVHYFVTADGHRKLTTQINIDGDEYLWDDFAFASREGLVPPLNEVTDSAAIQAEGFDKPYAHIVFDIRLLPETEGVFAAENERRRAGAR